MIAALYVETGGCYFGLPGVDPWDETRDARFYRGPWPVVGHPDCKRWGQYATSHPILGPGVYKLGDDGGCFASFLVSLALYGGVGEHPARSKAWKQFGLPRPVQGEGWIRQGALAVCHVEQGHYGHFANKPSWLVACGVELPELDWSKGEQRIHPVALAKHGYEKARRIGMMAMVGGKDKTKIRNATPPEFRDILIQMARTAA